MGNYATLAEVKAFYGITDASQDAAINAALPRVTALFNAAWDRDLRETEWTEQQDGLGSPFLFLDQKPIVSITSIEEDGDAVTASSYVIYRKEGYVKLTSSIEEARGFTAVFPRGDLNLEIVYKAGYLLEGSPTGNQILLPEDIKQAAIQMVGWIIKNPDITNYISERIGNYTYRKGTSDGAKKTAQSYIPAEIWAIIFRYERLDFETTRRNI